MVDCGGFRPFCKTFLLSRFFSSHLGAFLFSVKSTTIHHRKEKTRLKDENADIQLSCKGCLLCGGACGMTVSGRPLVRCEGKEGVIDELEERS